MDTGDPRNRPVILRTESPQDSPRGRRPRPRTVLGMSAVAVLAAAGVAAGSWSVWAVIGTTAPTGNPAPPLWYSPPAPGITTTVDIPPPLSTEDNPNRTLEHEAEDRSHRGSGSSTTSPGPSSKGEGEERRGPGHSGRG